MPTPAEKRALLFLASVAVVGVAVQGLRGARGGGENAPVGDKAGLARQIRLVDSAIASGGRKAQRAKKEKASPRTGDSATASAITTPPARRRVPPLDVPAAPVDNRDRYRELRAEEDARRQRQRTRDRETERTRDGTDGTQASRPRGTARTRAPVDLDIAAEEEIATLPAIGEALARRIVQDRVERGPFGSLDELRRVRGIGAALARRIAGGVTFSRLPVTTHAPYDAPSESAANSLRRPRRRQP
jgi:DNA uptake protein ComE-like DNA-binding protein